MCAVSMVIGHFKDSYPDPAKFPPLWYADYLELVRKAKLYDEMMKQTDCPDAKKVEWSDRLESIMKYKK